MKPEQKVQPWHVWMMVLFISQLIVATLAWTYGEYWPALAFTAGLLAYWAGAKRVASDFRGIHAWLWRIFLLTMAAVFVAQYIGWLVLCIVTLIVLNVRFAAHNASHYHRWLSGYIGR